MRPKNVFLILEGHPYELRTVKALLRLDKQLHIFSRQIALLDLDLAGVRYLSEHLSSRYRFLVTGRCYQDLFVSKYGALESHIVIVGSNRYNLETLFEVPHPMERSPILLFCPEGTADQAQLFADFATTFSAQSLESKIIFRFHPDMPSELKLKLEIQLSSLPNITVSKLTDIQDDVSRANYIIYQKSSAVIFGIARGLQLIFLAGAEGVSSPLQVCGNVLEKTVRNTDELFQVITAAPLDDLTPIERRSQVLGLVQNLDVNALLSVLIK